MSYATAWFLVSIGGAQWIGPLSEQGCQAAAPFLRSEGVVCRQANKMMTCAPPNTPGAYMPCPVFDFPQVTVKP